VVIPLAMQHYMLLQRNLIYTDHAGQTAAGTRWATESVGYRGSE
jgi:hypothetical protein